MRPCRSPARPERNALRIVYIPSFHPIPQPHLPPNPSLALSPINQAQAPHPHCLHAKLQTALCRQRRYRRYVEPKGWQEVRAGMKDPVQVSDAPDRYRGIARSGMAATSSSPCDQAMVDWAFANDGMGRSFFLSTACPVVPAMCGPRTRVVPRTAIWAFQVSPGVRYLAAKLDSLFLTMIGLFGATRVYPWVLPS